MEEPTDNFIDWAKHLDREAVNVWREAMAQLRRLSDDVWNGLRFFLSFNGIVIAACAAVIRVGDMNRRSIGALMVLVLLGFLVTLLAHAIMTKQRTYYLQMLLKKSLVEKEMGFYDITLLGENLSFIWSVPPDVLKNLKDPEAWVREARRGKHTITRFLFMLYDALIIIYIGGFILLGIALYVKSYS